MKIEISPFLGQINSGIITGNFSNIASTNNPNSSLSKVTTEDVGQMLQREIYFRNFLIYGLGRLFCAAFDNVIFSLGPLYNALPTLKFPTAEASIIEDGDVLTLSDDEVMRLLKSKIIILGALDRKTESKILKSFLKAFCKIDREEMLTKINFDIFLRYNAESKFVLHAEEVLVADLTRGHYKRSSGAIHITLPHIPEIGHDASDIRSQRPFQHRTKAPICRPYHHMDDEDTETPEKLVNEYIGAFVTKYAEIRNSLELLEEGRDVYEYTKKDPALNISEKSKFLNEIVPNKLKEKLCPDLMAFEQDQTLR